MSRRRPWPIWHWRLFPHEENIDGRWIIKVQVPASSQIHRSGGQVFLRSEDGDYRISDLNQIAGLVNRKLSFFTEQRVLPHLDMSDLKPELFEKAKKLMRQHESQHPWSDLLPTDLLRIAGFVRKDIFSGKDGYTLAAALMFGTDEIIQSIVPGYKFDALLRRHDTDRYDDRLTVRTNLIDAFDLLMGFVEKHLPDPFYLEGHTSISLRSRIFRELIANIIAHREYTSAAPATMIIYRDRIEFKNPNVPHGRGPIDPNHFTPYPKNPTICKFMIQLGRYEELGSGINNVNKYLPFYAPNAGKPQFIEADMFTTTVPLEPASEFSTGQVTGQVEKWVIDVLSACQTPLKSSDIQNITGIKHRETFQRNYLDYLLNEGLLVRTIPNKPQSRLQRYRLTEKGSKLLKKNAEKK